LGHRRPAARPLGGKRQKVAVLPAGGNPPAPPCAPLQWKGFAPPLPPHGEDAAKDTLPPALWLGLGP